MLIGHDDIVVRGCIPPAFVAAGRETTKTDVDLRRWSPPHVGEKHNKLSTRLEYRLTEQRSLGLVLMLLFAAKLQMSFHVKTWKCASRR